MQTWFHFLPVLCAMWIFAPHSHATVITHMPVGSVSQPSDYTQQQPTLNGSIINNPHIEEIKPKFQAIFEEDLIEKSNILIDKAPDDSQLFPLTTIEQSLSEPANQSNKRLTGKRKRTAAISSQELPLKRVKKNEQPYSTTKEEQKKETKQRISTLRSRPQKEQSPKNYSDNTHQGKRIHNSLAQTEISEKNDVESKKSYSDDISLRTAKKYVKQKDIKYHIHKKIKKQKKSNKKNKELNKKNQHNRLVENDEDEEETNREQDDQLENQEDEKNDADEIDDNGDEDDNEQNDQSEELEESDHDEDNDEPILKTKIKTKQPTNSTNASVFVSNNPLDGGNILGQTIKNIFSMFRQKDEDLPVPITKTNPVSHLSENKSIKRTNIRPIEQDEVEENNNKDTDARDRNNGKKEKTRPVQASNENLIEENEDNDPTEEDEEEEENNNKDTDADHRNNGKKEKTRPAQASNENLIEENEDNDPTEEDEEEEENNNKDTDVRDRNNSKKEKTRPAQASNENLIEENEDNDPTEEDEEEEENNNKDTDARDRSNDKKEKYKQKNDNDKNKKNKSKNYSSIDQKTSKNIQKDHQSISPLTPNPKKVDNQPNLISKKFPYLIEIDGKIHRRIATSDTDLFAILAQSSNMHGLSYLQSNSDDILERHIAFAGNPLYELIQDSIAKSTENIPYLLQDATGSTVRMKTSPNSSVNKAIQQSKNTAMVSYIKQEKDGSYSRHVALKGSKLYDKLTQIPLKSQPYMRQKEESITRHEASPHDSTYALINKSKKGQPYLAKKDKKLKRREAFQESNLHDILNKIPVGIPYLEKKQNDTLSRHTAMPQSKTYNLISQG